MSVDQELRYIFGAIEDWGQWNKRSGALAAPPGIIDRIQEAVGFPVPPLAAGVIQQLGAGFFTGPPVVIEVDSGRWTLGALLGEEDMSESPLGGPECILWHLDTGLPEGLIPLMVFEGNALAVVDSDGYCHIWDPTHFADDGVSLVADSVRELFYMFEAS